MILIKKFKKIIPSFRHRTNLNIIDNTFIFLKNKNYKKFLITKNLIKRKKKLYNSKLVSINHSIFKKTNITCKTFFYDFKPYKKFIYCQTRFNINYVIPGIENLNIGKTIFSLDVFKYFPKVFFFKGLFCYLHMIPYSVNFCNITNLLNQKITYAKSAGTFCRIKKTKKTKKKLILIILPSKQEILLNKTCKAYIGKNQNFRINTLTEGKYGFGFHKKKKINVRGVAMNPVDHPNGGRAKTVQPERSPWNWVAKKKK